MDVSYLLGQNLFAGLSQEELEKVASLVFEEIYKKGTTIIKEGEITKGIYFIISGKALVRKNKKREEGHQDLFELSPGDAFGELEFLDIQPAAASVIATEEARVVVMTNRNLYSIKNWNLQTFTMIVLNLSREISRKLRHMDDLATQ